MKIKEFENGLKVELPLLITRVTRGVTQNSEPYLTLTLKDDSGEIDGKLWKVTPEQELVLKQGVVADFSLEINLYRQNLQARIHNVKVGDQSQYDLQSFANTGIYEVDFLKNEISKFILKIQDPIVKELVEASLDEVGESFYQYPAATRNHHDFVGGLATHVYGMLQVADSLCEIYPFYNRDLMIGGVLLHDLGKIEEYTAPLLSEYSAQGKLLGHISIAHSTFVSVAKNLGLENTEQALMLRHMILSHHGQLEFGSPVMPMIKEAELLNLIDNLDARTNMLEKVYNDLPDGEFSTRVFALENRNFYKAKGVK